jgi:hypothetical protein
MTTSGARPAISRAAGVRQTVAVRFEHGWDRTATTAADINRISTAVDVPRVEHEKLTGDGRGEPGLTGAAM